MTDIQKAAADEWAKWQQQIINRVHAYGVRLTIIGDTAVVYYDGHAVNLPVIDALKIIAMLEKAFAQDPDQPHKPNSHE